MTWNLHYLTGRVDIHNAALHNFESTLLLRITEKIHCWLFFMLGFYITVLDGLEVHIAVLSDLEFTLTPA
jgi:hypothetical protein